MYVCYCHDKKYRDMSKRSFETVIRHNPDAEYLEIDKDEIGLLDFLPDSIVEYSHLSRACLYRFLIPYMFPHKDRVLYLDSDTVCMGDISGLYSTPFERNYFVACRGHDASLRQQSELGFPWYVNSGVLLFNIVSLLDHGFLDQIRTRWKGSLGKPKHYSADETILNWVFHYQIKLASERYNYCWNRKYKGREIAPEDVLIWHVCGPDKGPIDELRRHSLAVRA